MEPQEATVQGCTAEWIGGLILVVIAKPFTDAFLKALGETAGKGLASQIKKWFSRARAKGYAKVSLAYLDRKGRLIGKPPWVKSIIQFDIAVRLKDGSTKIASFVLPRNLRNRDLDAALAAICLNDFSAKAEQLFFVYSRRQQKWVSPDDSSPPKGRKMKIGDATVTIIKSDRGYL